jgi:putative transcriptional regulator
MLGIHYQTVGYIERGEYAPSLNLALRIAGYFGLPVEAVFSLEPFGPLGADAFLARPPALPD